MDEEIESASATAQLNPKRDIAAAIYTSWRNTYLNELPVAMFSRLEAVSEHLINEIAAHL